MIECEFKCYKRDFKPAKFKIKVKATDEILKVCEICLEYFKPEEIIILERY